MIKKTIKVTKTDIALAVPRNCQNCPIARAVPRVFKSAIFVEVDTFDRGERTKPLSFVAKFYKI